MAFKQKQVGNEITRRGGRAVEVLAVLFIIVIVTLLLLLLLLAITRGISPRPEDLYFPALCTTR